MRPFIVWWIKRDLRIGDNAALNAACQMANERRLPLFALYIYEPESIIAAKYHPRRDRFVYECLQDLSLKLQDLNVPLVVAKGSSVNVFSRLQDCGLKHVFSHEETGVLWTFRRDLALKIFFKNTGITWQEFPTNGVIRGLRNRDRWQSNYQDRMAMPLNNVHLRVSESIPTQDLFSGLHLDSACEFALDHRKLSESPLSRAARSWTKIQQRGGETTAQGLLNRFLQPDIHRKYLSSLSRPRESQTFSSRLSPYLTFGCISSRQILAKLSDPDVKEVGNSKSLSAFRSRLAWKCHFIQKLENFPAMEEREQNAALANLRPEMSTEEFERWHHGMTGYPLIDACLRAVHSTGFLNFRMRAMLMSFASHLMWRDWRIPSWDLAQAFLDFEPGIHFSQVQMQASVTGNNQIRIYNPVKQSLDNDPNAVFIKQWLPELKDVEPLAIHNIDSLPAAYPRPIVELNFALARARETLFKRFKESDVRAEAQNVQLKLGSRSGPSSWRNKQKFPPKNKTRQNRKSSTTLENFSSQTLFDEPSDE